MACSHVHVCSSKSKGRLKQGNYVPDMATEETGVQDGGAEVLL